MYRSFRAKRFRCFEDLVIEPLSRVNLITGKNNVGKTALLEALWLHYGYFNPSLGLALRANRGMMPIKTDEFFFDLFNGFDPEKTIELVNRDEEKKEKILQITIHRPLTSNVSFREKRMTEGDISLHQPGKMFERETTAPVETEMRMQYTGDIEAAAYVYKDGVKFKQPAGIKEPIAVFLQALRPEGPEAIAERFGDIAVKKKEKRIVEILKLIEPRLESLALQYRGGSPVIHGDIGMDRLVPLPFMGDGMGRLMNIILPFSEAQNGAVLVDEFENGLHYSVMQDVWKAVYDLACEYNVQFYATTHSFECVHAAQKAFFGSRSEDFVLHRLERVNDKIQSVTYEPDMLEAAMDISAEVR